MTLVETPRILLLMLTTEWTDVHLLGYLFDGLEFDAAHIWKAKFFFHGVLVTLFDILLSGLHFLFFAC